MSNIYNSGKCNINNQNLHENSIAINAGTYNNIIFEDPFRYYSEITLKEYSKKEDSKEYNKIANKLKLVELFIQKDILKKDFWVFIRNMRN